MRNIFFFLFLFLFFFPLQASAFCDDVERYSNDYTDVYTLEETATGSVGPHSMSVSATTDPRSELTDNTVLYVASSAAKYGGGSGFYYCTYLHPYESSSPAYFSYTVLGYTHDGYWSNSASHEYMYIKVLATSDGTTIAEIPVEDTVFTIAEGGSKVEIVQSGSYYDVYVDGTLISSIVATVGDYSGDVYFCPGVKIWTNVGDYMTTSFGLYYDDLSTDSIIGCNEVITEAEDTLMFTWSTKLMRSYPNSDFSIDLYSITNTDNTGKVTSWNIPADDDATTSEFGYFIVDRQSTMGNNYGLYLLEITRDGIILADTYFYYDNLANPIGFPDVVLMGTTTVSSDIRDSANNGGVISPNGYVYLFAETDPGVYPVNYTLINTPYSFTAELSAVYGADGINSTPVTFKSLTNSYTVTLDGASVTGSRATGELSITGNLSENETVTIGDNTYEFDTDDSYTSGNIPVKLSSNLSDDSANLTNVINNNGTENVSATRSYTPATASEYNYAPITITNNPGISGYQASINLSYQTGMSSDFANIRFYNNSVEIPYWIQSYTASTNATVWIPINASSNIESRWGISGETLSESDGSQVMDFYDNFTTDKSASYTLSNAAYSAGNYVEVTANNGYAEIKGLTVDNFIMNYSEYTENGDRSNPWSNRVLFRYQGSSAYYELKNDPAELYVLSRYTTSLASGASYPNYDTWHDSYIRAVGSSLSVKMGTYATLSATDATYSSGTIRFTGDLEGTTRHRYKNIIVRKVAATEPTLTLGTVTVASSGPHAEITVQADSDGSELNGIATTETCVNATWAGSTLSGGTDGSKATDTWSYTIYDWTNYTSHVFSFTPDLTKAGVYGYVRDLSTSQGIHGAIVTISNDTFITTVQTDEQGYYYLTQGMKAGETYSLKAQKSGYTESTSYTATTKESASSRKDIYLESTTDGSGIYYQSHDVTFTVLEYWYSSAGLPGVSYEVYNGSTSVKNGTTGSKGTFTVTKMNAGTNYTFILTSNGTSYTEYLEPGLTEYNLVLNKEGIVHQYYNSWLNLTYAETSDNVTVLYASNKTVSAAFFTATASNGTIVQSNTLNTTSGTFLFNFTEGDYILQFNIEASDGSTASQAWSISSPPEITLFPDSYPTWLKNSLFVAIIIIFLMAFGKSKNDIACGAVAVLTSFGYYFEWLSCGFNFVVLIWIIALAAIYLHYKRTGHVG